MAQFSVGANTLRLIAQRGVEIGAYLDARISELRKQEHDAAAIKVRELISEFGLTQQEIFGGALSANKAKSVSVKIAAKYRDPETGKEWSGRGLAPKWMSGQDKAKFLIAA